MNKNTKKEVGDIVDGMTQLETTMAQYTLLEKNATLETVAKWVADLSRLSSRLDKIWKGEVK